jgi:multiple antibiotic resistance protein
MSLSEYILFAFSSLFVIVDPIATVPAFLAMTPTDSPSGRIKMARLACIVTAAILLAFSLAGKMIFSFLGHHPGRLPDGRQHRPAPDCHRYAARPTLTRSGNPEETDAGMAKADIAITPLAVPMLAGPGAISTVILLHSKAADWSYRSG